MSDEKESSPKLGDGQAAVELNKSDRVQRVDTKVLELAIKHTQHGTVALKGNCPECNISASQLREVKAYWDEFFKAEESDCHAGTAILQVAALHMRNCKAENCLIAKYLPQFMPYDVEDDVFNQQFQERTLIGSGGFGTVYKVKHRLDKQYYAVKAIRLDTRRLQAFDLHPIYKFQREGEVKSPKEELVALLETWSEDHTIN